MTVTVFSHKGRTVDFRDAAARHLDDAKILAAQNRPDNSCYHSGYAVECTVKLVLYLNREHWFGHLRSLIPLINGKASTQIDVPTLLKMNICSSSSGWLPDMRYDASRTPEKQAQDWLTESESFLVKTHTKLVADGVL